MLEMQNPEVELPLLNRLRILTRQPHDNPIAQVFLKLPQDVREWVADNVVFIWPTKGFGMTSFLLTLDSESVEKLKSEFGSLDLVVILFADWLADAPKQAQLASIVDEIARNFINSSFVPAGDEHPKWDGATQADVQKLVTAWGFWK